MNNLAAPSLSSQRIEGLAFGGALTWKLVAGIMLTHAVPSPHNRRMYFPSLGTVSTLVAILVGAIRVWEFFRAPYLKKT